MILDQSIIQNQNQKFSINFFIFSEWDKRNVVNNSTIMINNSNLNFMYKSQQVSKNLYNPDPIESIEGNLLFQPPTSDRKIVSLHGPNKIQGTFIQKLPDLKYQVKCRLNDLHSYQMPSTQKIIQGVQQYGYFLFKKTGIIYRGEWTDGNPNGWGQNFYPSGGYYEGSFADSIPHGAGRFVMENGDFYEGQVNFGRANGHGYFQAQKGTYKGQFKDNLKHGYGIENTEQFTFEGTFQYGQRKQGQMKYKNGDIYQGQFQNNQYNGNGILATSEGIYTGTFRNGLQNGYGQYQWKDGSIYRGNYYDGQRQGDGEFYNSKNFTMSRGFWKKGVLEGQGEYVEAQGKMFKCIWNQGKITGLRK